MCPFTARSVYPNLPAPHARLRSRAYLHHLPPQLLMLKGPVPSYYFFFLPLLRYFFLLGLNSTPKLCAMNHLSTAF